MVVVAAHAAHCEIAHIAEGVATHARDVTQASYNIHIYLLHCNFTYLLFYSLNYNFFEKLYMCHSSLILVQELVQVKSK